VEVELCGDLVTVRFEGREARGTRLQLRWLCAEVGLLEKDCFALIEALREMGVKVPEPPVPLELVSVLRAASPGEAIELVETLPHGDLGVLRLLEAAESEGWVTAKEVNDPQRALKKVPHQVRVRLISNLLEEWGLVRVAALEAVEAFEARCAPVGDRVLLPIDVWESVASRFFASALSREVYSYVRNHPAAVATARVKQEQLNPWHMWRLRDCILDLRDLKLVPPSLCDWWFTYQVPLGEREAHEIVEKVRRNEYDIESNAVYASWRSHFTDEDWQYFVDAVGVWAAPMRFRLLTFVVGERHIGKSSLLAALTKPIEPLVGRVPLSRLQERFGVQPLIGKQLNVYSEQPFAGGRAALKDLDTVNNLVGEDDFVYVDRKHKPPIAIRSLKTMTFAMVSLPVIETRMKGSLEAFIDRLSIVFMQRPENFQPEHEYAKRVPARDTFAFLIWARKQLEDRNWEVRKRDEDTLLELLIEAQSPVYRFVAECCVKQPQARIERGKLYDEYTKWCLENGFRPLPRSEFYTAVRSMGFAEKMWRGVRYFFGITTAPEAAQRQFEEEHARWLEGA